MVEFYKLANEYRADIEHVRTGAMIDYSARVFGGPSEGRFYIEHSHVLRPTEGAGFYYSDSYTTARSVEDAEIMVKAWAEMLAKSYEIKPWRE